MSIEMKAPAAAIGAEATLCEEMPVVRWGMEGEIRRLGVGERMRIAEIARRLSLDRTTRPPLPARRSVAAVSSPSAVRDPVDAACRLAARAGGQVDSRCS